MAVARALKEHRTSKNLKCASYFIVKLYVVIYCGIYTAR